VATTSRRRGGCDGLGWRLAPDPRPARVERLDRPAARESEPCTARGSVGDVEETATAFVMTGIIASAENEITTATVSWPKRSFDSWWSEQRLFSWWTSTSRDARRVQGRDAQLDGLHARHLESRGTSRASGPSNGPCGGLDGLRDARLWRALGTGFLMNSGARYSPSTDAWSPIAATGAPAARDLHTAVWTGTEMIVWGGGGAAAASSNGWAVQPRHGSVDTDGFRGGSS
jgi:hypothetical protein